ncbi:LPXTG-motif protein cell wall anchor domain protein [Enterococcus faecalis 13-SD-W-01]|nr:LPXTG-motif protein cell wall anchor domain protein [Enterococcus faecalis 13-SD-W-01]
MKIWKKMLNSALVLGIILGSSSGTVVEATSALSRSRENRISRATRRQEEEEKAEAAKKEPKEEEKDVEQVEKEKPEPLSTERNAVYDEELRKAAVSYFETTMENHNIDVSNHTFNPGDSSGAIGINPLFNIMTQRHVPNIPTTYLGNHEVRYGLPNPSGSWLSEDEVTYISESGNWQMRVNATQLNGYGIQMSVTFFRLKVGALEEEIFKTESVDVIFERNGGSHRRIPIKDIKVRFPTAHQTIGAIRASAKSGEHRFMQGDNVPQASAYVESVSNTRGSVNYRWGTPPDMNQVGRQTATVIVGDATERTLTVNVPITIDPQPLEMSPKSGSHTIYQYSAMPNAADYFDVRNGADDYRVEWIDGANTLQSGTQTWRARASTPDGREVTSSTTMEVIPHPGLQMKLKPVEDRALGQTYPALASNFRDYIEEITMFGEPVDLSQLQFVAAESMEPDHQTAGLQTIKLTVQMRHPVNNAMIKGTAETTVNVRWGHTLFLKSHNGGSAGAFSLRLGNTANATAGIIMTPGTDTSLDAAVGPGEAPFDVYYTFDVLRNDRVIYHQEITNRATLRQIRNNFGNANNIVDVQLNDVIRIYHPNNTGNRSVVMINEQEEDFTYGADYAYYRVTAFGFDPFPVMEATASPRTFDLAEDTSNIDLSQLLENVTINGKTIDQELYEIEQLNDFDTSTVGERNVRLRVRLKDGLASAEVDVPYEVNWGSTIVLKGLEEAIVGSFTFVGQGDQAFIHSTAGDSETDLDSPVNNVFGRGVYYRIEVEEPREEETEEDVIARQFTGTPQLSREQGFRYEVTGNTTIRQAISRFNNGRPLAVSEGSVVRVFHAEPDKGNLLMRDNIARDFTGGTNFAQYKVTNNGFEPISAIQADTISQRFILGQDGTEITGADLVRNVTFNGEVLTNSLYRVDKLEEFDTSSVGEKTVKVRITALNNGTSTEVEVPYTVEWGEALRVKNGNDETVGAFSLINQNERLMLHSVQGASETNLTDRITEIADRDVYYRIEVLRNDRSRFNYEVRGNITIGQAIARFNNGQPLEISVEDTVKIYHSQLGENNLLMFEGTARDYTYGGHYAYYDVTPYGFEPTGVLAFESSNVSMEQESIVVEASAFVLDVTVNGVPVPERAYTVALDSEVDTTRLGNRTANVTVTTDRTFGRFTTSGEVTYQIVEQGRFGEDEPLPPGELPGAGGSEETGETDGPGAPNPEDSPRQEAPTPNEPEPAPQAEGEQESNMDTIDRGNLPQTNATRSTALSVAGLSILALVGGIVYWKKRKAAKKTVK